jgi:hypothetical protein
MASRSAQISDAVIAFLAVQLTNVSFVAGRENFATIEAEKAKRPLVFVTPVALAQGIDTREQWFTLHELQLTVCQQLIRGTRDEEDALIELAEGLPLRLVDVTFAGAVLRTIEDDAARTVYDVQTLETASVFFARTALVFHDDGV